MVKKRGRQLQRSVGLAFYNAIEPEFNGIKIQFPGISTDVADEEDEQWLACYLLNTDKVKARGGGNRMKRGLLQVSCFARFAQYNKDKQMDVCWTLADKVDELLDEENFTVYKCGSPSGTKEVLGCVNVISTSAQYVNENDIAKSQARGFLDPSNVHAVVVTARFQVTGN